MNHWRYFEKQTDTEIIISDHPDGLVTRNHITGYFTGWKRTTNKIIKAESSYL